jgi:mannose-6-phosphate isomerase-like protein (cupin superfamily)
MGNVREFMTGWFGTKASHMLAWSNRRKEGLMGSAKGKHFLPGIRPFDMLREPNQALVMFENADQRIGVESVVGARDHFVRNIDFDEVYFQFAGSCTIETEFGEYAMRPGELMLIPAGIAQRSTGTADCLRMFARLNEPVTHMFDDAGYASHVDYEVARKGGPSWKVATPAPRKSGTVSELMITWRDTPEYYTTAERDYEYLVGASSTERDAKKSGIKKVRAFDYFTEITGRRGPGPKVLESPNFVVEVYNTDGEQFAFHRALRSEEFGLQFRGSATNMSEFDAALPMSPGDVALVPLGIAHSVITGKEFLRIVMYSRIPWDVRVDPAMHAWRSTFEVVTKVVEPAAWWASAAE